MQVDWLILRLRPNSVLSGSTETQLEVFEQSPQPSQTRWLMKTRWGAFAASSLVLWLGVIAWGRLMPFLGLTF